MLTKIRMLFFRIVFYDFRYIQKLQIDVLKDNVVGKTTYGF